jgi:crotonobetainyl-CoA:carnitine CoA-transferase CaiB-like acyl-CoA transferase
VGEHGREVLAEAGLAPDEIEALIGSGVVRIGEGWR